MLENYRTNYSGSLLQIQKQYTGWAKNGATDYDHNSVKSKPIYKFFSLLEDFLVN